jgi:hypothetical protein
VALAFLAGVATSIGPFIAANPGNPGRAAILAAGAAALYAGGRGAVGYLVEMFRGFPLSVDTEA